MKPCRRTSRGARQGELGDDRVRPRTVVRLCQAFRGGADAGAPRTLLVRLGSGLLSWTAQRHRARPAHRVGPGPTERVAGRVLVDAGGGVRGFLSKLGLTRSYVCLNAFPWALFPAQANTVESRLAEPEQALWRNRLHDLARTSSIQAVCLRSRRAGCVARVARQVGVCGRGDSLTEQPRRDDPSGCVARGDHQVTSRGEPGRRRRPDASQLRPCLRGGRHSAIPRRDLPFGVPSFLGDGAWKRAQVGRGTVFRPSRRPVHAGVGSPPVVTASRPQSVRCFR